MQSPKTSICLSVTNQPPSDMNCIVLYLKLDIIVEMTKVQLIYIITYK